MTDSHDNPEKKRAEVSEAQASKNTIDSKVQQKDWQNATRRGDTDHVSATHIMLSPEERRLLAQSPGAQRFGIDGLEAQEKKKKVEPLAESDPRYLPAVNTDKVCGIAEKLGYSGRFAPEQKPVGPKCNLYVDAVMHEVGMPRPWGNKGAPLCIDMQQKLMNDSRYEAVWNTDYNHYQEAYKAWDHYHTRAGDVALWNTDRVTHAAIADGKKGFYYAGSDTGFKQKAVTFVTGTSSIQTNYGPPSMVFRYKNCGP